jgi:hypothetical protein
MFSLANTCHARFCFSCLYSSKKSIKEVQRLNAASQMQNQAKVFLAIKKLQHDLMLCGHRASITLKKVLKLAQIQIK